MSTPGSASATTSSTSQVSTVLASEQQASQGFACVLCSQRKIKCDRARPSCSKCIRSRAECVYRAPDPPKRRKRKEPEGDDELRARLNEYERLLKKAGIEVESVTAASEKTQEPLEGLTKTLDLADTENTVPHEGHLFIHGSKTKYHENNLYNTLESEIPQHEDYFREEEEPEHEPAASYFEPPPGAHEPTQLLFATPPTTQDLRRFHPPSDVARQMWHVFKDRVDPLVKIFQASHKELSFLPAIEMIDAQNMSMNAWMFSIYLFAVVAVNEEECMSSFGEDRTVLFNRFRYATQQALIGAGLIRSSDTIVLQAFIMFIMCVGQHYDAGTFFILTGIAIRIGQRGGLHRDQSSLGPDNWPWHAEMRRRIWWHIILLDIKASELTGLGPSVSAQLWDTKLPLNVNDSDLDSIMRQPPEEHVGATDMIFCLVQYETANFFREVRMSPKYARVVGSFIPQIPSEEEKDKLLEELEQRIEQKYLRYCDPLIPLHYFCLISARAMIASSKLIMHYAYYRPTDLNKGLSQERSDKLFDTAIKIIDYQNLIFENDGLCKFVWLLRNRMPWHALIFVLSELRVRTGDDVGRAWSIIANFMDHHKGLRFHAKRALNIACANLALKAWDARINSLQARNRPAPQEPNFITDIREKKERAAAAAAFQTNPQSDPMARVVPQDNNFASIAAPIPYTHLGPNMELNRLGNEVIDPQLTDINTLFDFSPGSWSQWDELISHDIGLPQSGPGIPDLFT
ncbi:MAG: hypothetical protein M1820_005665 [Bogoriella megaspora]|nr:MAG: hypothetical protein M1820_005665 [Bogoriella megaspora]